MSAIATQPDGMSDLAFGGSSAADARRTAAARVPEAVAILIGQLAQGGSERQLYMFLVRCDRTRWAPTVYVSGTLGYWEAPIRALGIPIVLLVGSRISKLRQLRTACIAQGAVCLFSWSSYTNPFGLALLGTGIRRVGSFRNAMFSDLPTRLRPLWSWASLAGISTAVCNSRDTFEQLSRRGSVSPRAVYVPNCVEAPGPAEIARFRSKWRERLGLQDDTILILGVGRLAEQKRFDRFIDVVDRVKRNKVKAVIAGDDLGLRSDLEERIDRLALHDIVSLIGVVPDARELICAADIFLLTSDHEGTPNVLLEAMAAGRACVATPVNGVAELIDDGTTGFASAQDAAELAGPVARLIADPDLRRRVGAAARAAVERGRSPTAIGRELWSLCEPTD